MSCFSVVFVKLDLDNSVAFECTLEYDIIM